MPIEHGKYTMHSVAVGVVSEKYEIPLLKVPDARGIADIHYPAPPGVVHFSLAF